MIIIPQDIENKLSNLSEQDKLDFCINAINTHIEKNPDSLKQIEQMEFCEDNKNIWNVESLDIYTDWGARWNPWPSWTWWVIKANKQIIKTGKKFIGTATNNQAEYQALLFWIEDILKLNPKKINIFMDSELIVKQLSGIYKVKNKDLKILNEQIKILLKWQNWSIKHVKRNLNKDADRLVNEVIDANT